MEGTLNTTITLKEEILKSRREIAATEGLKAISIRFVAEERILGWISFSLTTSSKANGIKPKRLLTADQYDWFVEVVE